MRRKVASYLGFEVKGCACHYLPNSTSLLDAVLADIGYGVLPAAQALPLLRSGRIVDLAPKHQYAVELYWHHWKDEPRYSREIVDLIATEASLGLERPARADSTLSDLCRPLEKLTQGETF